MLIFKHCLHGPRRSWNPSHLVNSTGDEASDVLLGAKDVGERCREAGCSLDCREGNLANVVLLRHAHEAADGIHGYRPAHATQHSYLPPALQFLSSTSQSIKIAGLSL